MKLSIYETISHIVGSYPKRKEWNRTHDNVVEAIHWELAGKRKFERNERWYDHVRRKVCLKMTTTNLGGTSVFEQNMKLGPGDWIWWSLTRETRAVKLY